MKKRVIGIVLALFILCASLPAAAIHTSGAPDAGCAPVETEDAERVCVSFNAPCGSLQSLWARIFRSLNALFGSVSGALPQRQSAEKNAEAGAPESTDTVPDAGGNSGTEAKPGEKADRDDGEKTGSGAKAGNGLVPDGAQTGKNDDAAKNDGAKNDAAGSDAAGTEESGQPAKDLSEDRVTAYEREVARLVNIERAKRGLQPLAYSEELSAGAREKCEDMRDNRYFSHNSPTFGSPFDHMRARGITYRSAGENIAMGYATPEAVVDAWMNSEGHRKNILNASFSEIGVGYAEEGHYAAQWFRG